MLHHIVLFNLKLSASEAHAERIYRSIRSLKDIIPGIDSVSSDQSERAEKRSRKYDYGFMVTFLDRNTRDAYLEHPLYREIKKEFMLPYIEEMLTHDFCS